MNPKFSLVEKINTEVNSSVVYRTDSSLYKKEDFWTVADNQGDCEDYALAKRKLLIEMGYESSCRLATCWTETGEYHAVLVVTTEEGDYVLDNRFPSPMKRQDVFYRWHMIQEGDKWHNIL